MCVCVCVRVRVCSCVSLSLLLSWLLLQSETAKDSAWLLFDTALLNSGFQMDDPKEFSGRMFHLMQQYVH